MDHDDFGTGARMIVTAVISAVVTATLVISIGQSIIDRSAETSSPAQPTLIRTSG